MHAGMCTSDSSPSHCFPALPSNTKQSFMAWLQTQHKVEMDKRDGKFGPPPVMAVPPVQQMSRIDQPIPPPAGYAPQPAYGQPYGIPPPAYPPTGYPPAYPPPGSYPPAGSYPPPGSYPAPGYPPTGYPK
ncbi:hypothetical protein B296_00040157 [Ensete ventricosum]|uniref:Uncharacterized protein n=1 Tax=Ensete ventricosum TaxID=4639 RepID=A0A426ZRB4_ENSVE|nr:hypothetical protein B296_00040157 [Ensete ventricosum]